MMRKLFTLVMAVGWILLFVCFGSWLFVQRNAGSYPLLKDAATPENVQIMLDLAEKTGVLQMMGENMTESNVVSLGLLYVYAKIRMLSLIGAVCAVVGLVVSGLITYIKER